MTTTLHKDERRNNYSLRHMLWGNTPSSLSTSVFSEDDQFATNIISRNKHLFVGLLVYMLFFLLIIHSGQPRRNIYSRQSSCVKNIVSSRSKLTAPSWWSQLIDLRPWQVEPDGAWSFGLESITLSVDFFYNSLPAQALLTFYFTLTTARFLSYL